MITNILITGPPGVGKTTLVQKLFSSLKDFHPVGFYTQEIREKGVRKGFGLASFDGERGILSHVNIHSHYRVGKYGVDIKSFENFLGSIAFFDVSTRIIIIDEIGKMECLSHKFKTLVKEILDSHKLVIATIALRGTEFISQIKKRPDTKLFQMSPHDRDSFLSEILSTLNQWENSPTSQFPAGNSSI